MSIIACLSVPEGRAIALASGLVWLLACGPAQERAAPPADPPPAAPTRRVVSLSPLASRFLIELGAGDQIVAVDAGSSRIPALSELPVVDLAAAGEVGADLILWPGAPAEEAALAERLRADGHAIVVFEPHSLDEAFAVYRDLGARLVGTARARSFENGLARQLAAIGGASFGRPRPRVAAVIGPAPLEFAGGHSVFTDLIEIAGASSVTHGGEEPRIPFGEERLKAFAPDLLLVFTPGELSGSQRREVEQSLPSGFPIQFFVFDPDLVWTQEVVEGARRLRALIEPLSREMEGSAGAGAPPATLPSAGGEGG